MAAQDLDPRRLNQLLESVKAELTEAPGLYARANQLAQKAVIALQDAGLTLDSRKVKAAMPCRDTISASRLGKALDLAAQSADEVGNDPASEAAGEALDAVNQAADFAVSRGLERPAPGKPKPAEEPAEEAENIQPNTPLTAEEQTCIRSLLMAEAVEGEPANIAALRGIVRKHEAAKVGGQTVDAFTASAMIQVYDALNPANRAKFAKMPIRQMADVTWKLVKGGKQESVQAGAPVQLEYQAGLTVDQLVAAYAETLAKFYKQKGITHLQPEKQAKKILAQGQAWAKKGSHADLFGMNQSLAQAAKALGFANSESLRKFLAAQKPLATEAVMAKLAGMKAIAEDAPPTGLLTVEERQQIRKLLAG